MNLSRYFHLLVTGLALYLGALSTDALAATVSQTISFNGTPEIVLRGGSSTGRTGTIFASASSGLPLTFSSLTPSVCTVFGATVTGLSAGTCTIAADQAGNHSYSAAPRVTQSFTIMATQIIQRRYNLPTIYAGGTGTISAQTVSSINTNSITGLGLAVSMSSTTPSVCTVSDSTVTDGVTSSTVTGISAGTCTIALNQAGNTTYLAAAQSLVYMTINPGHLNQTITFAGAPSPPVSTIQVGFARATATSGLPVTFNSLTPNVCTVSNNGRVDSVGSGGECIIAANQAGGLTYNGVAYNAAPQVTQTITINKIDQALSFGSAPAITLNGTGTVSATMVTLGLPITFTSLTPSVCTVGNVIAGTLATSQRTYIATVTGLALDTCIIAANQAGNANFNAAPQVTQSIHITTDQTISFGSLPALGVGSTGAVSATATSGLPVTLTSTTPNICSVSGYTVTGIRAGTCTIAADQAGDSRYNAALQVTQDIIVSPPISNARVFAFAEGNYSSLFAGTPTSGQIAYQGRQYTYRYYPVSGNYLAIDSAGIVSILGTYTGGVVIEVGQVESFRAPITAWEKAQADAAAAAAAHAANMESYGYVNGVCVSLSSGRPSISPTSCQSSAPVGTGGATGSTGSTSGDWMYTIWDTPSTTGGGTSAGACGSQTYTPIGSAYDPQIDSNCQYAQQLQCMYTATGNAQYLTQKGTVCTVVNATIQGFGVAGRCRYCP